MYNITHSKPLLTIFADASVKERTRKAGWGGWAIYDGKKSIYSSGKVNFINNSSYAELVGLTEMVKHVVNTEYAFCNTHMTLQSDSLTALGWIYNYVPNVYAAQVKEAKDKSIVKVASIPEYCKPYIDELYTYIYNSPLVYLKHIKGHQKKGSPRAYINDRCDRLADKAST